MKSHFLPPRYSLFAAVTAGALIGGALFWVDNQLSQKVGQVEIGIAFGSRPADAGAGISQSTLPSVISPNEPSSDETAEITSTTAISTTTVAVTLPSSVNQSWRDEVLFFTNTERLKQGLTPLASCNNLHKAAQNHSFAMYDQNFFEHDNPNTGEDPGSRSEEAGYGIYVGENIAMGHLTPKQVVRAWMNSSGHRENILGDYNHLGVGITRGGSDTYGDGEWFYWVQNFGSAGDCD